MEKKTKGFENLQVYQLAETLSNTIWQITSNWEYFEKTTVGKQIVRSADSVGRILPKVLAVAAIRTIVVSLELHEVHYLKLAIGCDVPITVIC